ncbi:protein shisa-5-like [Scyliorhinus canicula]|uniref:protein shisa-5-like n=1 Tax=Scyliorhinus canicula TaxID=7830 RepID=UPI0018F27A30|nr:protein shisa-5-like [Scyliorhinus canicula]
MQKLGFAYLLVVGMAILPSLAALDIECSLGFSGVSCRQNNTTQKILIGVGVALSVVVVVSVLACCCCGCCRSSPQQPTVVTAVTCSQQMPVYPPGQGYHPLPLQLSPAQLAMPAAPYSNQYPVAYPNYCQPPTYQEASSMRQPQYYPATQPYYTPAATPADNLAFVDPQV